MTWQDIDPRLGLLTALTAVVAVVFALKNLIDWRKTRKARRVLAESMDHAMRPSEEVSLNAWMHVPDQQLSVLAEALSPGGAEPVEPASLACPRDSATLTARLINAARFYVCPSWGGMWVSDSQLRVFLASSAVDLNLVSLKIPAAAEHQPKPARGSARCLCARASQMKTVRRLSVAVDLCPDCGAIWLDGGELLTLADVQWLQQQHTRSQRPA